jgi:hypothetical protein
MQIKHGKNSDHFPVLFSSPPFGGMGGQGNRKLKRSHNRAKNRLTEKLHITLPAKNKLLTEVFLTPPLWEGAGGGF